MKRYRIAYADWTAREYGAIARCILAGKVYQGPHIGRLAEKIRALYAPSDAHLLNYAHHGIALALRWFQHQQPGRQEVIVPAYICPSVPQTVRAAGLRVRCAAVGEDLNVTVDAVRGAINPRTLAVIAPHMYGCPAPIAAIEALCQEKGVFLIDDAAQVVGERVAGRLLGTFGDVGVVSFAQSKAVVTGIRGSGGVLLVNRPEWKQVAVDSCTAMSPARGRLGALADFLWNYIGHAYTGHTGYYLQRLWQRSGRREGRLSGPTCISNLEAAVALVQLDRWDGMRRERLRLLQVYQEAFSAFGDDRLRFPQYLQDRYLARVVVHLRAGVDAQIVRRYLAARGVESRAPYPSVAEADDIDPRCDWAQGLIGLPTSANLSSWDVSSICAGLHEAVRISGGDGCGSNT